MSLSTSIKKTTRAAAKAMTGETAETDILESLKKDHDAVAKLLKQLVASESGSKRKSLLKEIKAALVPHVRAEEKIVYDAVLGLREKDSKEDGQEGYIEHHLVDKVLSDMSKLDSAMSPEFAASAKVLKELVEHHVKEEETNIWADVKKNFSDEERAQMNTKFEAAKKVVKIPQ